MIKRPRARDLGIKIGRIKTGRYNAITDVAGVRVGVKNGGCAGMEYTMEYADDVRPWRGGSRSRKIRSPAGSW